MRAAYAVEMKSMLYRYLAPCVGTGPVTIGEAETSAAHALIAAAQADRAAADQRTEHTRSAGGAPAAATTSRARPTSS